MQITLDGREVKIDCGGYEDEDDMLCRGCGAEVGCWSSHTVVDCLRTLREAIIELQKELEELKTINPNLGGSKERKIKLYGKDDIESNG